MRLLRGWISVVEIDVYVNWNSMRRCTRHFARQRRGLHMKIERRSILSQLRAPPVSLASPAGHQALSRKLVPGRPSPLSPWLPSLMKQPRDWVGGGAPPVAGRECRCRPRAGRCSTRRFTSERTFSWPPSGSAIQNSRVNSSPSAPSRASRAAGAGSAITRSAPRAASSSIRCTGLDVAVVAHGDVGGEQDARDRRATGFRCAR